jgi:hypothetical protein
MRLRYSLRVEGEGMGLVSSAPRNLGPKHEGSRAWHTRVLSVPQRAWLTSKCGLTTRNHWIGYAKSLFHIVWRQQIGVCCTVLGVWFTVLRCWASCNCCTVCGAYFVHRQQMTHGKPFALAWLLCCCSRHACSPPHLSQTQLPELEPARHAHAPRLCTTRAHCGTTPV